MATTYFWVGGTGNTNDTTHYSLTTGGAGSAGTPIAGDTVNVDSNSGGSAFTITVNAAFAAANVTVNNANCTWLCSASMTLTGQFNLTTGTFNGNSRTDLTIGNFTSSNANARTLTLGSAAISLTGTNTSVWNFGTTTNLTVTANTATLTINSAAGSGSQLQTFAGGGFNWNGLSLVCSGKNWVALTGANTTLANITVNVQTAMDVVYGLSMSANYTVTGNFTTNGTQQNRVIVWSKTPGTQRTITCNGTVSLTDTIFQDIVGAGTGTWSGTRIGDAGNNSGITFTGAVTRYCIGGNYSATSTWASSSGGGTGATVPLPQDTAVMDGVGTTSGLTIDVVHVGTINATSSLRSFTVSNSVPNDDSGNQWVGYCGSFTLASGQSKQFNSTAVAMISRGSVNLNIPGSDLGIASFYIGDPRAAGAYTGGTVTLQGDLNIGIIGTSNRQFFHTTGTFNANGFNIRAQLFSWNQGLSTKTVTGGTGTWIANGGNSNFTFWQADSTMSPNFTNTTIQLLDASTSSTQTFAGNGFTYGTFKHIKTSTTNNLVFTGANTFTTLDLECTSARTVTFPASTTTRVTKFTLTGASAQLLSLVSSSPGTTTTIAMSTPGTFTYNAFWTKSADVKFAPVATTTLVTETTTAKIVKGAARLWSTTCGHASVFTKKAGKKLVASTASAVSSLRRATGALRRATQTAVVVSPVKRAITHVIRGSQETVVLHTVLARTVGWVFATMSVNSNLYFTKHAIQKRVLIIDTPIALLKKTPGKITKIAQLSSALIKKRVNHSTHVLAPTSVEHFGINDQLTDAGTWFLRGQLTDGNLFNINPGMAFEFSATNYADVVSLDTFQSSTHIRDFDGNHLCSAIHLNNTMYVDSTHVSANGASSQAITTLFPARTDMPVRVTFATTKRMTVSNVSIQAVDPKSPNLLPYGIEVWMLEQGVSTQWHNIAHNSVLLSGGSGASSYDWYLALSALPLVGNERTFGLRFTLDFVFD